MRICLLKPNKGEYSETFIARQVNLLDPAVVLYDGWYPTLSQPSDKSFLPFPFNLKIFRGSFRNLFPNIYHTYYTKKFSRFLREQKIDLVLANYGPMGVSVMDACKLAKTPLVVHFHGFDAHHHPTLIKYENAYRKMFKEGVSTICVSVDMKKKLETLGAKNIYLNPYAIDSELFSQANPKSADKVFVFVGRFTAKKNPMLLVKSMAKVIAEVPDAKLIMIGDGTLYTKTKELTQGLGLEKSIEFWGSKDPADVSTALKSVRAFVQHSLTAEDGDMEGTPNTILEASSSALPVISTFHAGIKEAVIHEETGFLVNEGDWETMADYMILLARDPELATSMGLNGRKHIIKNYSVEGQVNTLKKVFEAAVRNKGRINK